MNDESLESFTNGHIFKFHSLQRSNLASLRLSYKNLPEELENALKHIGSIKEPRSESEAEEAGITYWANYDYSTRFCPTHNWYTTFIKTKAGWMRSCCAQFSNLTILPNTHTPLNKEQITALYADKKVELELLISYLQKRQTARSVATKQAKKLALKTCVF